MKREPRRENVSARRHDTSHFYVHVLHHEGMDFPARSILSEPGNAVSMNIMA